MAAPTTSFYTLTTVLEVKDFGDGRYEVKEVQADEAVIPDLHGGNRMQLDTPLPVPGVAISAYYDPDDKEIGAYATLMGKQIGTKYTAGLDSGINIELDLAIVGGGIRIFKSGNALKASFNLSAGWGPFKKTYSDEFHLLDL